MPPKNEISITLSENEWSLVAALLVRASGELGLSPDVGAKAYRLCSVISQTCMEEIRLRQQQMLKTLLPAKEPGAPEERNAP